GIKTINEETSHIRQPPIVTGHLDSIPNRCRNHGSVTRVAGVWKPVEISFDAENDVTPELVVEANLAAARELALIGRIIVIQAEAVGDANRVPAPTNVGAEVETGPTINWRRRYRNVSRRSSRGRRRRREIGSKDRRD